MRADTTTPRPLPESYWIVPGRLLVGAHPGSRSRAQAMERLRRFIESGITYFVDLTEASEAPAYETLLPFDTPTGLRIEYVQEPILDHGVPDDRATMARILQTLDEALAAGHNVYVHCRAGIGRSAMVAGCWLAERCGGDQALVQLYELWQPSAQARVWPGVPETDEQVEFVRGWSRPAAVTKPPVTVAQASRAADATLTLGQRVQGAWYGLALGDAIGAAHVMNPTPLTVAAGPALVWTQHTSLALCLAESLLSVGKSDARDQIERYLRWQREGYCSATGEPGEAQASDDIAKALAAYQWRGLPMAGSHDPQDCSASSLPRVLSAALYAAGDPDAATTLAAESSRTTHQSPTILDACRLYAAIIDCGLRGQPAESWLTGLPEPAPSCWSRKPLRKEVAAVATQPGPPSAHGQVGKVLRVLADARRIAWARTEFDVAMSAACRVGREHAPVYCAIVGTLFGLRRGPEALPSPLVSRLAGKTHLDAIVRQFSSRATAARVVA